MPTLNVNGVDLNVVERGGGSETVVLSHSFLADHRHFEPQIEALAERYRVVAYDHRDHGDSALATGPYDIYDLMNDGRAVIEHMGAAPCHWVGLSTGGFVGMRLAVRHPELIKSLVLMDTASSAEPLLKRLRYHALLFVLSTVGPGPVMSTAMKSMFGRSSLRDPSKADMLRVWRERIAARDAGGLVRFGRAIWSRDDVTEALRSVDRPTLVVVGEEDVPLPVPVAQAMAEAIPGARFTVIPKAGHLCTLEQPEAVNEALLAFLATP